MKLFVVTGMSGAGKSKAVDFLEDAGYYCLDNLPVKLLPSVVDWMASNTEFPQKVAVTLDIRSKDISDSFFAALESVKKTGVPAKVLFLECEDAVLMKRYKESRRLHPLMNLENRADILTALKEERKVLSSVRETADFLIDTSNLATAMLRGKIMEILEMDADDGMLLHFMSFGYKYGIPADADLVFDVRFLPNPFYIPELKHHTGQDREVSDYVMSFEQSKGLLSKLKELIDYLIPLYISEGKSQLVIAFGCTGGKHRSVTFAEKMYEHILSSHSKVRIAHRDISKDRYPAPKN